MFVIIQLLSIAFYFAVVAFLIWFALSLVNQQRERNRILNEISQKLDFLNEKGNI